MGRKVRHLGKWIQWPKKRQSLLLQLLPSLCCLPRSRELLEFNFSIVVDGAMEDEATKIAYVGDRVSDKQTVECKVVAEGMIFAGEPKNPTRKPDEFRESTQARKPDEFRESTQPFSTTIETHSGIFSFPSFQLSSLFILVLGLGVGLRVCRQPEL
ncbi:hypothetical protein DVH24_005557 [Malus domestica]|uniref:Uncharacterized protein n=1 Tax=Malus domestica TaxID=3750 RepID=A0A498IMA2_MALDO|nr:hypothetical protein DVH24_005557 [Malus domestica]